MHESSRPAAAVTRSRPSSFRTAAAAAVAPPMRMPSRHISSRAVTPSSRSSNSMATVGRLNGTTSVVSAITRRHSAASSPRIMQSAGDDRDGRRRRGKYERRLDARGQFEGRDDRRQRDRRAEYDPRGREQDRYGPMRVSADGVPVHPHRGEEQKSPDNFGETGTERRGERRNADPGRDRQDEKFRGVASQPPGDPIQHDRSG